MSQLYIPVKKEINGPWLIGNSELEELDEIVEIIDKELSKSFKVIVEEEAKLRVSNGRAKDIESAYLQIKEYFPNTSEKKVTLISKDEKKLIDKSIKGILKDPKLKDFSPEDLRIELQHGRNNKFSLIIERRFDGRLSYKAESTSEDSLEEIKYKIENWIEKHQPNSLRKLWPRLTTLIGLIGILILASPLFIKPSETSSNYKHQVDSLLKVGVNNQNQAKAIELLLKNSTDYNSTDDVTTTLSRKTIIRLVIIGIFLIIIAIFNPKTTIGIGKYKGLLKFYKVYTRLILFTIPVVFLAPILIDFIKRIFGL